MTNLTIIQLKIRGKILVFKEMNLSLMPLKSYWISLSHAKIRMKIVPMPNLIVSTKQILLENLWGSRDFNFFIYLEILSIHATDFLSHNFNRPQQIFDS